MFQKMLQGGGVSGEVDYFYWASTSNKKTTTIITSGYKKITFVVVKDPRNQAAEDFPIANVKEFTIEELAKHTHTYQRAIYNAGTNGFLKPDGKSGIGGSYTTGETGESKPHNNLQPYITCYMWKRTA